MNLRGERGAVAIGVGRAAPAARARRRRGAASRGAALVLDERVHGSADAVALAAAAVLERGYGDAVDAGGVARCRPRHRRRGARRRPQHGRLARADARVDLVRARRRTMHRRWPCASGWPRARTAPRRTRASRSRRPLASEGFRLADVRGLDAGGAVVAAALAQLGWPYVWGGESRAEGGFDCSGLIDYALAAAGVPVGRLTAAGLQQLARPLAHRCCAARPAISCSSGCPRTMSASWSRPGSPSRRRTAERASASRRSARAAGPAPGGFCCRARPRPRAAATASSPCPPTCRRRCGR